MIRIRTLQHEDEFRDLITLSREFFREYQAYHATFFKIEQLNDSDIVSYFSRWIDDENGDTFIALDEDRIVGYLTVYVREQASFWKVKRVGDISGLMVHKDQRRRGIAGQLLDHARAFLARHAVEYFTLFTSVANKGAIAFYEQHGLAPLHTTMLGVSQMTPESSQEAVSKPGESGK